MRVRLRNLLAALRGFGVGISTKVYCFAFLSLLAVGTLSIASIYFSRATESAAQRRDQARAIRHAIVAELPGLEAAETWLGQTWWFLVTLGEAYFGLSDYDSAECWLLRAAKLPGVADWERESTARQLARLLRIKDRDARRDGRGSDDRARRVLVFGSDHRQ